MYPDLYAWKGPGMKTCLPGLKKNLNEKKSPLDNGYQDHKLYNI